MKDKLEFNSKIKVEKLYAQKEECDTLQCIVYYDWHIKCEKRKTAENESGELDRGKVNKGLEHHGKELKFYILLIRQGELQRIFKKDHGIMRMVL